jgi:hypothetical protein
VDEEEDSETPLTPDEAREAWEAILIALVAELREAGPLN